MRKGIKREEVKAFQGHSMIKGCESNTPGRPEPAKATRCVPPGCRHHNTTNLQPITMIQPNYNLPTQAVPAVIGATGGLWAHGF